MTKTSCAVVLLSVFTGIVAPAQTFTYMGQLSEWVGIGPTGPLVQGLDGNLYGTAPAGGLKGLGTIFELTREGKVEEAYTFHGSDPAHPGSGLIVLPEGALWGTAPSGGANGLGGIFRFTPGGTITTLHSFNMTDGAVPLGLLVQGIDGMLYGTTSEGGADGGGTVFQLSSDGEFTTLHNFSGPDGLYPAAGLVQAANGMFYGTTSAGGANQSGTIYSISPNGTFTLLYDFGALPAAGVPMAELVQTADRKLYGTTESGGTHNDGAVFQITPAGAFAPVHFFDDADGALPSALIQGTDGNLYGTTSQGGIDDYGTIFQITPTGELITLYLFTFAAAQETDPRGALVQGTDGNFYGTTARGGNQGDGVIFQLSMGLAPFVRPLPAAGKVGSEVTILGSNLKDVSSVTFNGTPASFTAHTATVIKAIVPTGATSGTIEVITPGGAFASNVQFQVL